MIGHRPRVVEGEKVAAVRIQCATSPLVHAATGSCRLDDEFVAAVAAESAGDVAYVDKTGHDAADTGAVPVQRVGEGPVRHRTLGADEVENFVSGPADAMAYEDLVEPRPHGVRDADQRRREVERDGASWGS